MVSRRTSTSAETSPREGPSDEEDIHELEKKQSQAIEEGHDADIPSSAGYILDARGERKRKLSLASRRRSMASKERVDLEGGDNSVEDSAGDVDSNEVWWDGPNDPENPYNWPTWKKIFNCGLVSAMTFVAPLGSSIFAPSVPEVMAEFKSSSLTIASFVVSVYILGFAFGPLIIAPLSEIYGRLPVYHACNLGFVAFAVGCALAPSLNALIVIRFFSGLFGCATVTIGGGSIADMVAQEYRGAAMSIYSIGPLFGPIVGPVSGGFLTQAAGWRWTFWLLAILSGVLSIIMVLTMRESYAHVILERKAARLRKETGNGLLHSRLDIGLSTGDYFKRGIIRPLKLFVRSPIILITSIYMSICYGYLYLMFTTMTTVFQETYGFSTGTVGLAYLGLGVGNMVGVAVSSLTSDKYLKRKAAQAREASNEEGAELNLKPEYRLPLLPLGAALVPIGLFIYGWTAQYRVHWIVPIISHVPIGVGNLLIFLAIQMYIVDSFTVYAASALATNTVVRSIAGALLPLAGLPMFEKLDIGWGNSLLGFIAILMVPIAFGMIKWGENLRNRFPVKNL
ncbi:hypothetical protein V2G26_005702 [Clonostachys chloroleuca]|uniref:Major facilitator superfamily (MFS) profile domain-containing protein n=1 Tax=Clonostachys chloroleuca TaxID=1926264 RepID=A0AA35QCA0_9HYPO|nr:unnamed protein product [Clonostachys chloroleuca]